MRRSAFIIFLLSALPALALYLNTLAPSLSWAHASADGGDLISAALSNGVPHPPGYPTYITLGQIITRLPWGDVAQRFNAFSALCMALAVDFTALSIARLLPTLPRFSRESTAIVAALFFATAPMVWGQATVTEVHALNAALVAVIVYLIAPIVFHCETSSVLPVAIAAWLWGLAIGHAVTSIALAPLFFSAWRRNRSLLPLVGFILGLSIYALIPLRAAQQPIVNWGDATTLERFSAVITAEMYRGYAFSVPPAEWVSRLVALAQALVTQYGWVGVILCGMGSYAALISPNRQWRWLAATIALYLIFALTYHTADSALYLIPVWMFGAWAIARGMLAILHARPIHTRSIGRYGLFALIFLSGPILNVAQHYQAMDLRSDTEAVDYAQHVLAHAPPDALVITETDGQTFALWYHRALANTRPELAVVDRRLAGYPWYEAMLRAQGAAPILPEYDPQDTWLRRLAALNPDRVICLSDPDTGQLTCP